MDIRESVASNAIGYELYSKDGREVFESKGVKSVVLKPDEIDVCEQIAKRVIHDLDLYAESQLQGSA